MKGNLICNVVYFFIALLLYLNSVISTVLDSRLSSPFVHTTYAFSIGGLFLFFSLFCFVYVHTCTHVLQLRRYATRKIFFDVIFVGLFAIIPVFFARKYTFFSLLCALPRTKMHTNTYNNMILKRLWTPKLKGKYEAYFKVSTYFYRKCITKIIKR